MSVAKAERQALCDLFDELGPDEPTLCAGWQTRDMAAHLVLRERRPDAAPGILLKPLAGYTKRVQDSLAGKPFPELVDQVRSGPPRYMPTAIGAVDDLVNTSEFFVHHEDVRRGQPGWEPRPPDPARDDAVWSVLQRSARMLYRRSPVGVVLRRPSGDQVHARQGATTVTLVGEPIELLLHGFGRAAVRVETEGAEQDVAALAAVERGV